MFMLNSYLTMGLGHLNWNTPGSLCNVSIERVLGVRMRAHFTLPGLGAGVRATAIINPKELSRD